jgi:type I restriction enzyme M protein
VRGRIEPSPVPASGWRPYGGPVGSCIERPAPAHAEAPWQNPHGARDPDQRILGELTHDGRCAIVLDDGFLFRKDENAFVETKRKLVDECDLWAIIKLPVGVFVGAGATVNTNLVFFSKGRKTEKIWYYDLTHLSLGKKSPMTLAHFGFGKNGEVLDDADLPAALTEGWAEDEGNEGQPFPSYARLFPARGTPSAESRYSWTVDFAARRSQAREDMKPHVVDSERAKAEALSLKERLRALRAANPADKQIEVFETKIREQEKIARDAQTKLIPSMR